MKPVSEILVQQNEIACIKTAEKEFHQEVGNTIIAAKSCIISKTKLLALESKQLELDIVTYALEDIVNQLDLINTPMAGSAL